MLTLRTKVQAQDSGPTTKCPSYTVASYSLPLPTLGDPLTPRIQPPPSRLGPLTWNNSFILMFIHFCPGHSLGSTLGLETAAQVPSPPWSASSSLLLRLLGPRLGYLACCSPLFLMVQWFTTSFGEGGTMTLSSSPSS